jgi:hypothetical protein
MRTRRTIVAGLIVTAGLGTAGIAYAQNQPPDPSMAVVKAAATGAPAPGAAGGKAGVLKGAIHGDLLVRDKDGSTHTVTFDRGKVSSISASSITVQRPDGVSVTDDVTDQTVFNGTPKAQLQAGTPVIVIADGHTATHVVTRGAAAGAVAKACATTPADGSAAAGDAANGNGATAGKGLRAKIRDRVCQRVERRQQRRANRGLAGSGAGQNPGQGRASAGQGGASTGQSGGQGGVTAGPSSVVDDGSETIVS